MDRRCSLIQEGRIEHESTLSLEELAELTGSDGMGDMPYTIENGGQDRYPLMNPWIPPTDHNIAIISVMSSKSAIGRGYSSNLTVYGANRGVYPETFNIIIYTNTSQIASAAVPLGIGSTTTLTFSWSTTNVSKGSYVVSAYAQPVPNEANKPTTTIPAAGYPYQFKAMSTATSK